jgi:hypothetical protein
LQQQNQADLYSQSIDRLVAGQNDCPASVALERLGVEVTKRLFGAAGVPVAVN